jgi:hypothetical protein
MVQSRALNELLFREAVEFTSCDLLSTFESTSGRERPARSALTLVLDRGDSALSNPIYFGLSGNRSGGFHAGSLKVALSSRAACLSIIPSRTSSSLGNARVLWDSGRDVSIQSLFLSGSP